MNNEAVFSARLSSTHHVGLCRLCSSPLVHTFVDLGMSPPCESFVAADAANDVEPFYPLHAFVCDECFLVQLQEYVAPENIFTEYAYFSSFSDSWVAHAKRYCDMVIERFALGESSFVVELASNDGYLLQHFLTSNIPMLGIEPAVNVAKVAIGKGIPTLTEFFNEALATDMAARGQKLISSSATMSLPRCLISTISSPV